MYNRVGLKTARGSGTNGFIEKNKASLKIIKSRNQFLKELKNTRNNIKPIQNKPNKEIINHIKEREIYVYLDELKDKLLDENQINNDEINILIAKKEKKLLKNFKNNKKLDFNFNNIYDNLIIKDTKNIKFKNKINLNKDYKIGSAFDFENIQKIKLEKELERELNDLNDLEHKEYNNKINKNSRKIQKFDFSDSSSLSNN